MLIQSLLFRHVKKLELGPVNHEVSGFHVAKNHQGVLLERHTMGPNSEADSFTWHPLI